MTFICKEKRKRDNLEKSALEDANFRLQVKTGSARYFNQCLACSKEYSTRFPFLLFEK